jgi:hypothetical protein
MTMSPAAHAPDAPTIELLVTDKVGLLVGVVGISEVPDVADADTTDTDTANRFDGIDTIDVIDDEATARPPRMTMSLASAALLPLTGAAPHLPARRARATERLHSIDGSRITPERSRR